MQGGRGNNVEFLLVDQANNDSWHSGLQSDKFYDSGQATSGTINAHLTSPDGCYLVYSNTASTTGKNIQTTTYLYYIA